MLSPDRVRNNQEKISYSLASIKSGGKEQRTFVQKPPARQFPAGLVASYTAKRCGSNPLMPHLFGLRLASASTILRPLGQNDIDEDN